MLWGLKRTVEYDVVGTTVVTLVGQRNDWMDQAAASGLCRPEGGGVPTDPVHHTCKYNDVVSHAMVTILCKCQISTTSLNIAVLQMPPL